MGWPLLRDRRRKPRMCGRAISSAGQSSRLTRGWPQVRILHRPPSSDVAPAAGPRLRPWSLIGFHRMDCARFTVVDPPRSGNGRVAQSRQKRESIYDPKRRNERPDATTSDAERRVRLAPIASTCRRRSSHCTRKVPIFVPGTGRRSSRSFSRRDRAARPGFPHPGRHEGFVKSGSPLRRP